MAMTTRDIETPGELVSAWNENEISAWDAIAVLLHRVDDATVADWVLALPLGLQEQLVDEVTSWGPSDAQTVAVGRGAGLEESPSARAALRRWLLAGDDPGRWLKPMVVGQFLGPARHAELPSRFVARARDTQREESEWVVALERLSPDSLTVWLAVLPDAGEAKRLEGGVELELEVGGQVVGELDIRLNAHIHRETDILADPSAPARQPAAA